LGDQLHHGSSSIHPKLVEVQLLQYRLYRNRAIQEYNHVNIQKAYSGLKAIGQNPIITYYNFCTNGSHYAGEAKIHTIGYGPSKENLAHVIDEYVEVEQIEKVTEGYYAILKAYLGK